MCTPQEDGRALNQFVGQRAQQEQVGAVPGIAGWCIGLAVSLGGYAAMVFYEQVPGCCLVIEGLAPDIPTTTMAGSQAAHPVFPSFRP